MAENDNNPGGQTLNERLRRAAELARQRSGETTPPPPPPAPEPRKTPESPKAPASQLSGEASFSERRPSSEPPREAPASEPPRRPRPVEEYYTPQPPREPAKKSKTALWLGIPLVLAVLAGVFLYINNSRQQAEHEQQIQQLQLANEQLQLANEYESLNNEFAQYENQTSLLANDSIVQKYSAARAQVEKLLQELKNEKDKSAAQISKLKGEIATLKGILRTYVEQIDSLSKQNQALMTENKDIKQQNQQLAQTVQSVQANNKELNERMTLAEKLNVTGVSLTPLNKKGKKEKNVTKARQLMVSFTIPQNNSTPVGEKTIYCRIINPEGELLGNGGSFSFEGGSVACTARKSVEYAGEEIGGIHIYWDVNATLTPGDYTVELFADNYRLASRRFTLKK